MSAAATTTPLERDALVAEARRRSGLDDIGDTWFYEPLDRMLDATRSEARLHDMGRVYEAERIIGYLANRLLLVDLLKRHPEIHDEEVNVAAAIVSLARTGSTKTHRMLGSAPGNTTMKWWESQLPIPFKDEEPGKPVARRAQADKILEQFITTMPELHEIIPMALDFPEEEAGILDHAFMGTMPEIFLWMPSYVAWSKTVDQYRAYDELKTVLKMLQWQEPARRGKSWILKSPSHLSAPRELLDTFPKALMIQTHRDPLKSIPSHCSMNAKIIRMKSDEIDPKEIGAFASKRWADMTHDLMDLRAEIGDDRFIDIQYQDMVDQPLEEARKVYARIGRVMSDADEAAITSYLVNNKREKWAPHIYDLDTYGLTEESIKSDFARYREAYCS